MRITKSLEFAVGAFILSGVFALFLLGLKVAEVGPITQGETYRLYAKFENIGTLKLRAPIKVGGVTVGRVTAISLDAEEYVPVVELAIDSRYNNLPDTTAVAVLTSGLLGEQYLGLEPGFVDEETELLAEGDTIYDTRSALVLEKLIAQYLFNQGE